jgi:hypothetical protein
LLLTIGALLLAGACSDDASDPSAANDASEPFPTPSIEPRATSTTEPAPTTTEDPIASLTPEERRQLERFLNPPTTTTTTTTLPPPPPAPSCDPNYSGCVPIASDVDCSGGSGDGPAYTGYTTVIGSDIYDLDSDGDGQACE